MGSNPWQINHVLYWPSVAGTEIATLLLMRALPDFSHTALCAYHSSAASGLFASSGFEVRPYHVAEFSVRRPIPFLRSSIGLARRLKASRTRLLRLATHFIFVSQHAQARIDLALRPDRASVIHDSLEVADSIGSPDMPVVRREFGIPGHAQSSAWRPRRTTPSSGPLDASSASTPRRIFSSGVTTRASHRRSNTTSRFSD